MGTKSTHERDVLAEFISAAGLLKRIGTIEPRTPPEPDLYCLDHNGPLYFELGRLLDKEMQRMRLQAMRRAPEQVAIADYNVKLPEREMLQRKIEKQYLTESTPLELLLYYDNTNWLVGDVPVVDNFVHHAELVMRAMCQRQNQFRRVWVFERHRKIVLWCYQGQNAD